MNAPRNRAEAPAAQAPISIPLREAIAARRVSAYRLAKSARVDERNIRRWLKGESAISIDSADRIAVALGLRLTDGPARKAGPRAAAARVATPLPELARGPAEPAEPAAPQDLAEDDPPNPEA